MDALAWLNLHARIDFSLRITRRADLSEISEDVHASSIIGRAGIELMSCHTTTSASRRQFSARNLGS